jgi:hypothetical protein
MADEKRDEGPGEGPRQGQGGRPEEGRRRFPGRHRGFRGRPGGQQGQGQQNQGQQGQGQQGPNQRRDIDPSRRDGKGPGGQPMPEERRDLPSCPLCGNPLYDLSSALASNKETGEPAHFDCVLERVIASETLEPGEKIVYLGSGTFGVVEYKDRSETAFTVKRRIQWEKEGEKREWRKDLSSKISNL